MNRERDAGREYAEIWSETVQANRKLRTLAMILAGACLALAILLLRVATVEPPRPLVVRVDEVGRDCAGGSPGSHDQVFLNRRIIQ